LKLINKCILIIVIITALIVGYYEMKPTKFDPDFNKQWALFNDGHCSEMVVDASACKTTEITEGIDIGFVGMWQVLEKEEVKRDVIVAIIDTGIDFSSRDLQDVSWENIYESPNNNLDDDGNGYVDDFAGWNFVYDTNIVTNSSNLIEDNHGTISAGIIAAEKNDNGMEGVTRGDNIKIMTLKVLGDNLTRGDGIVTDVICAIEYAEQMGASVCNLSLGTYTNNPELFETIKNTKMLFVTSAGNSTGLMRINIDKRQQYPASYSLPNLISVANLGFDGQLYIESNFGPNTVDLAAPGTNIYSTQINGKYGYSTGTSFAAPFVTGVAAVLYQYMEKPTPEGVKKIICDSTTKLPSLSGLLKTEGILNAENAVLQGLR
jgi:subtilisin family serine protease